MNKDIDKNEILKMINEIKNTLDYDIDVSLTHVLIYGKERPIINIKLWSNKLGKYFPYGQIRNLKIGTTFVEDVWELKLNISDNKYGFTLIKGSERSHIEVIFKWLLVELLKVEKLRQECEIKYNEISKNPEYLIREYNLSKICMYVVER